MENSFDGIWNERDIMSASSALVSILEESGALERFFTDYGRKPRVTIGYFQNDGEEGTVSEGDICSFVSDLAIDFKRNSDMEFYYGSPRSDTVYTFTSFQDGNDYATYVGADLVFQGRIITYLANGNFKRSGRKYRIEAELVDVETQYAFWSGTDDETFKTIRRKSLK